MMDAFFVVITQHLFLNTVAMFTAVSAFVPLLKEELQSFECLVRSKAFSNIFSAA